MREEESCTFDTAVVVERGYFLSISPFACAGMCVSRAVVFVMCSGYFHFFIIMLCGHVMMYDRMTMRMVCARRLCHTTCVLIDPIF